MRIVKLFLLIALIVVVESLWPWPYRPDLFLMLIITYSVDHSTGSGVPFSFAAGFVQDILFSVYFLNTLTKALVSAAIAFIKDKLILNFEKLSFILIIVFSPLAVFANGIFRTVIYQQQPEWGRLFLLAIMGTIFNIIFTPLFLYIIRKFGIYEGR